MKKKMVAVWALAAVLCFGTAKKTCPAGEGAAAGSRGMGSIGEHLGLL